MSLSDDDEVDRRNTAIVRGLAQGELVTLAKGGGGNGDLLASIAKRLADHHGCTQDEIAAEFTKAAVPKKQTDRTRWTQPEIHALTKPDGPHSRMLEASRCDSSIATEWRIYLRRHGKRVQ